MSWDIYERKLMNGLGRKEVVNLLGDPDYEESSFFAYETDDRYAWLKVVLVARLNMIVHFDKTGQTVTGLGFADR